jgi:hypothetical protein
MCFRKVGGGGPAAGESARLGLSPGRQEEISNQKQNFCFEIEHTQRTVLAELSPCVTIARMRVVGR